MWKQETARAAFRETDFEVGKFLLNEPVPQRVCTQLCIRSHMQLLEDMSVMGTDRFDAERQVLRNFLRAASGGHA
jgi:hypothetical protein